MTGWLLLLVREKAAGRVLHPKPACRGGAECARAGVGVGVEARQRTVLSGLQLGNVQRVQARAAGA